MFDRIYTLQITFGAESVEGVALVKGKFINGLDWNRIYVVQFSGQQSCEMLNSGCCGMAGSFGFEAGKFDVSIACGERVLRPAIRHAAKDTLIIADGFSCREQIQQRTDRHALHLAEVIQIALTSGPRGPDGNFPERDHVPAVKTISALQAYGLLALVSFTTGVLVSAIFQSSNR